MGRIYIHEFVDVIGTERARYQHHMTANWCPEAGPLRRQRCFGVFSVVGSTGRWPQVVNLWEYDTWDDLGHNFSVELVGAGHRDPMLAEWWARAAEFRTGGLDRILVAHDGSPGVEQWSARGGTGAVAYLHEIIRTPPGAAPELEAQLWEDASPQAARADSPEEDRSEPELVGLFRTAMRADDEVVLLRAVADWPSWARYETITDDAAASRTASRVEGRVAARSPADPLVLERSRLLLVDAELSPLRIGRQPVADDRRSLDEF